MPKQIGQLLSKETSVEWKIENFIDGTGAHAKSPTFQLFDAKFYILMHIDLCPNKTDEDREVHVFLWKESSPSDVRVKYTIRLKKSVEGSVFEPLYFDHLLPSHGKKFEGLFFINSQTRTAGNLAEWSGTLVVFCKARVVDDSAAEAETRTSIPDNLERLSRHFEDIYVNGWGTDAVIEVKGKKFPAHRLILSVRSSVFRSMFELEMKGKETGSVNITDCDPESFGAFLQYMYSGKFDVVTSDNACDLYATAEKYNVQDLKKACSGYMNRNLCVVSVSDVLRIAEFYGDQELLKSARIYFSENASEIVKTSNWQTFARENFTLANDLVIKLVEELEYNRIIWDEIMRTVS